MNRTLPTLLCLAIAGCGTPVTKPGAFDRRILSRRPLPGDLTSFAPRGERTLAPDVRWFGDVDPTSALSFAGYRPDESRTRFCVVLSCDPLRDEMLLLPLSEGTSPLDVINDPGMRESLRQTITAFGVEGRAGLPDLKPITLVLSAAIADGHLVSPLPPPGRVYAVAANFPSHLEHDLAIPATSEALARMRRSRARVFLKVPAVHADGSISRTSPPPMGPYDPFRFPDRIMLPVDEEEPAEDPSGVTRLDYEVEVGIVLGRDLTWETVRNATDEEIRAAIAGCVLVSDTKARNPQMIDKVADQDLPLPDESDPYRTCSEQLDRACGFWDQTTCRWWSYAASRANCTALGPLFVAVPPGQPLSLRAIISARTYADESERGAPAPAGRRKDRFYLRQCAGVTEEPSYADALIWQVPDVIRSILEPEHNALHFTVTAPRLERGDVICMGTPGGAVITGKPQGTVSLLDALLFWWRPRDWHDAFFDTDKGLYLLHGDQVFLWGEALGFQLHLIQREKAQAAGRATGR